jgi:Fe-S-cluster containining protein
MRIVPWKRIANWRCINCGLCCRDYNVVLNLPEWLYILKKFGVEYTTSSISRFYLAKKVNGSCVFLQETPNKSFCGIQHIKPLACKLWPFKILNNPKYGFPTQAEYSHYGNRKLYIYVDSACSGLQIGTPTQELKYSIIPEFIEIASFRFRKQVKSTAFLRPQSILPSLDPRFSIQHQIRRI